MLQGYGYEITEEDVRLACQSTIKAAKNVGEENKPLTASMICSVKNYRRNLSW